MAPRTKGSFTIKRQRARKQSTEDKRSYVIPLVGPYDALAAGEPAIGSSFTGFPSYYKVKDVSLEDTGGGSGKMLVTLEIPAIDDTAPLPTGLQDPIYELDWQEERRPVFEHPKAPKLKDDRPYYDDPSRKECTDAGTLNQKWAGQENGKPRTADHWSVWQNDDVDAEDWTLAQFKKLLESGISDYPVAYPVATVTQYARSRIAPTSGVNERCDPPSGCGAPTSGFYWIKSGARATKQGRLYSLVETYRGYLVGSDIYNYLF